MALAHAGRISEDAMRCAVAMLGAGEKRRLAGFVRPQRQRQFVAGRMLLRSMLAARFGLHAGEFEILERPGNSPRIVLADALPAPHFSLSHSGDWIACVISRGTAVGLDIEVIDHARDIVALGHAAFTPDECAWLEQQPHDRQALAFYDLWSLKEALYKMQGGAMPLLVDAGGGLACHGEGWHSRILAHPEVSLVICSALPLACVDLADLSGEGIPGRPSS